MRNIAGADLQIAIADWLLHSKVRIRTGRHEGGVAGWLNERGEPEFVYPEITGYYLNWLALVSRRRPNLGVHSAAAAAVDWLHRITSSGRPPLTRYYFDERDDWRNGATFTFDLAMLCRGLEAVRGLVPEKQRLEVLRRLLRYVLPGGDALPVLIDVRREMPDCWSTNPGPFQLKTAAALLPFQENRAVWGVFHRWSGKVSAGIDVREPHAAFYALEGLVQFGASGKLEAWREAADCYEMLFDYIGAGRSDVVAQGLRLGYVLRSRGFLQGNSWNDRLADLRALLETFITDVGAMSFRSMECPPVHFNTWAAIFAYQCFEAAGDAGADRSVFCGALV